MPGPSLADAPEEEARFIAHYDAAMVRRAVRTFMWRRVFRTVWFFGVVAGSLVLTGYSLSPPALRWGAEAGVGLLLLLAVFTMMVWRAHLQSSLGRLAAMSPPEALVILSPSRIAFRTTLTESAISWSVFTETWRLPGFWMLFNSTSSFNILPLAGADAAIVDLLSRRLPTRPRRPSRVRGA